MGGFSAISDDDFARVTIAQNFAHLPRLDPSGSSWLPFPFWLQGAVFLVFGRSLIVAQISAVVAAMVAGWLLDRSCRLLGAAPGERALAAALLLALPTTPFLAAATVPEVLTAGLVCFGITALAVGGTGIARIGGLALVAATLSRYETWPMALVAGVVALTRAGRDRSSLVPGLLAFVGPCCWLAWSAHAHGDALWALRRVSAFRAHAGGGPGVLLGYPLALLRDGAVVFGAAFLAARARGAAVAPGAFPLVVAAAGCFVFLLVGDVVGGAPTHHPERALLPAFWAVVVACAPVSAIELRRREGVGLVAIAIAVWTLRMGGVRASFVSREGAIREGRALALLVPPMERVVVARDTYATEATRAAFVRAEDLFPVVSRAFDARSADEPFTSSDALRAAARTRSAKYLVVDSSHAELARPLGEQVELSPTSVLIRLKE